MLIRLIVTALLAQSAPVEDITTRIATLRADLEAIEATQPQSPRIALERQLLISLERRRDLERAQADVLAAAAKPSQAPALPPKGLLEADDLRRRSQELDLSIEASTRRREIMQADRTAAAARLVQLVAEARQLEENAATDPERLTAAKLEVEFAESTTAELDLIGKVIDLQIEAERDERDAIAERLNIAPTRTKPTAEEVAEIERRGTARAAELQQRLADAAKARDAARDDLQREAAGASPARLRALQERVATRDIDIELTREAMSNAGLEAAAWQLAIRYWRDGDTAAVVEARERGPVIRGSLARRLDFLQASLDQAMAQAGALKAQALRAPAAVDAADRQALESTMDERVRLVERGMLDERHVLSLIERLRTDFDARIGAATWQDRWALGWQSARKLASRLWNFELFVVDQTVEVNGRQTKVPSGVTVAKVVKAPLVLLITLFLSIRLTAWFQRYAVRRGADPASARLTRRWTLGLLACACALASLAIAGIPFAAFAFIGGAVAIGVGFGMQTLFKNLISGVLVLVERPFRLGDEIQIGDLRGTVVDIDLRASVLRDSDGSETLIPNSALVEQNVTARPRSIRQTLVVTVDPQSDPREVTEAMRGAVERHGLLEASRKPEVFLDEFPGEGLRFSMNYWIDTTQVSDRQRVASDLRFMILNAFKDAGIKLAQGSLDLRVRTDEVRKVADALAG
ncbi:MAG TPA: mechanosensitive ion channel domain-containing protein [Rhodanobacteraceae bacterium]|nr:mechanosensitive ion channel domain-containing protein [Rhodanobacteraceae bacterium]